VLAVGVLGPTALITDDAIVGIPARRQAEVLAVLAAHRGRQVTAETIVDLVWRGHPPASAAGTLQGYVSRLRRLLVGHPAGDAALVTAGAGYQLRLPTDVGRFEAALAEARELVGPDPSAAAETLSGALGLWRGRAYDDVRDVVELAPEVERVEELRIVARELRGEALLNAGRDAEAVPELRELTVEHPLRERAHALLATALYRSGRQADALALLRDLRTRLLDELGLDPGREIRDLEQRLLRQDPALQPPDRDRDHAAPQLAGRTAELGALREAWEDARAGRVLTAVVRGESGIGKTALVEAFLAGAPASAGAEVRWSRCSAGPGAPALWPWTQVLGETADVAGDVESGRYALGLDVARRLGSLAGRAGAVVVLDDVHWADPDSLTVLETCLHSLSAEPVLMILTIRDELPRAPVELARVLDAMARRPGHVDLTVRGLTREDAALLVPDLPEEVLDDLVDRTAGNPFFLKALAGQPPGSSLPPTVRDMVRQRSGALPTGSSDVLSVLALAGRELPVTVLTSALGTTLTDIEGPLAAVLSSGLAVEPSPGLITIAHDIVREAVLAELTPVARLRLHDALAAAFEALGPGWEAALAEHRLAAAAGHRDDRAATAALVAAGAALHAAGLDEAQSLARRGIDTAADPHLKARLHRVAGVADRRLGRHEDSDTHFHAAAALARESGDWTVLAETALDSFPGTLGGFWDFGLPLMGQPVLLEEALRHLSDLPRPVRARLLAASASHNAAVGADDAAGLAEQALEEAGTDPGARARALIAWNLAHWTPDQAEQRLASVTDLLAISRGDTDLEATAHHLHRGVLLELGRTHEAARAARAFAAVAERRQDPDLLLFDRWWRIGQLITAGERQLARKLAVEAEQASATVSPAGAMIAQLSRATVDGITAWLDGDLMEALPEAEGLAVDVDPDFLLVVALAHAEAGHRDLALGAIDRLLEAPVAGVRTVPRTIMISEALVALGDAERLAHLVPTLRTWSGRIVVQYPGDTCMGPADLYLGAALGVTGETAEARELLVAALAQCHQIGAESFAARAERRLAELPARD
jgi:DNA-binding SARP family transcriptional activator